MINFTEDEVIISPEICEKLENEKKNEEKNTKSQESDVTGENTTTYEPTPIDNSQNKTNNTPQIPKDVKKEINLSIKLPKGKVGEFNSILFTLQRYFNDIEIKIKASNGEMSKQDYVNKVEETLLQLKAEYKEENDI